MQVSTQYLLKTDDYPNPAYITVQTRGWRTGPPDVMRRLLDPDSTIVDAVRPDEYFFRIFIEMETGDERYADAVNGGMWVGAAARKGAEGECS